MLRLCWHKPGPETDSDDQDKKVVHRRSGKRNGGAPHPGAKTIGLDINGTAGKPDAAHYHEEQRQHNTAYGISIMKRIEGEIPLIFYRVIATPISDDGMPKLVK